MSSHWLLALTASLVVGCKKKDAKPAPDPKPAPAGEVAPAPAPKPASASASQLTLIKEKGAPTTLAPQAGIASTGKSPGTFSVYLIGNCPALPANACEWLPKNWVNTDFEKLKTQCPDFEQVVIRFSYDDQMKAVAVTDLKPGKFGGSSAPIHGSGVSVGHADGSKNFQIYGDDLLELTEVDATHVAGKLSAKDMTGNEVSGSFSAKVCQYPE